MNAASGPTWWLVLLILLGLAVLALVRVVPGDSRLVLSRRGRVRRVAGPGLVVSLPGPGRRLVRVAAQDVTLVVDGTSRDDVDLLLLATVRLRLKHPQQMVGNAAAEPLAAAVDELEKVGADVIAAHRFVELVDLTEEMVEIRAASAPALARIGVSLERFDIDGFEAKVTPQLAQVLEEPG